MVTPNKPDMSCARVKGYKASEIGAIERHNERKNESYDNINVELDRVPLNVQYRNPDTHRITSYNVCYTKLLREEHGQAQH